MNQFPAGINLIQTKLKGYKKTDSSSVFLYGSMSFKNKRSSVIISLTKRREMVFFYFAYGINMNHAGMRIHCPGSIFLGPASLDGYSLVFDGKSRLRAGATANIIPTTGGRVWGGLFDITAGGLAKLDSFEGYPEFYRRKLFSVSIPAGDFQAWAYFRQGQTPGPPGRAYLAEVIQGAKDCQLPKEYIKTLRTTRAAL
jgi:gamma-glutamylcyclotransferase (GGCT)/AIG2-like uncharacterized protein YtfP